MSGRIAGRVLTGAAALAGLAAVATSGHAADNAMKACGAKYQTAKAAKTLPAGQTWAQFLAQCRAAMTPMKPAPVTPTARPVAARPALAVSDGRKVAVARERQCGSEWRAAKDSGKVPAGQTWPKYWSACNARLKR